MHIADVRDSSIDEWVLRLVLLWGTGKLLART